MSNVIVVIVLLLFVAVTYLPEIRRYALRHRRDSVAQHRDPDRDPDRSR
jgi:hypothetical protein